MISLSPEQKRTAEIPSSNEKVNGFLPTLCSAAGFTTLRRFRNFGQFSRTMFKKTFALLTLILGVAGCRSLPPMPPADLSSPEWTVLQGQAVWRASHAAPEIAGEILVATNTAADTLVQFTKT